MNEGQGASQNFTDFLVASGVIDSAAFQAVSARLQSAGLSTATAPVSEVIKVVVDGRFADEEAVIRGKADFLGLPYVDLRDTKVPQEVLDLVPAQSMQFYSFVPFEVSDGSLSVALLDPTNGTTTSALEFLVSKQGLGLKLFVASQASISSAQGLTGTQNKNIGTVVEQALKDYQVREETDKQQLLDNKSKVSKNPEILVQAPIVKIVDSMLSSAMEAGASDIHIEPSETDVRVRFRIDGILYTSLVLPKSVHGAVISRIKILSNLKIDEQRLPQDGRFHFEFGRRSVDLRIAILPLIYGEKVVMRLLDKTLTVPTLEQLGARGKNYEWIVQNLKKTHGVVLVTGPTGSGKSTTLYSVLTILNTTKVNIITLEDPVEYFIAGVNQSQINPEIGLTFANGLRSILRQDPNIIMVGEIRDKETAELGVHAALTGHLVFSTLHTNDSVGAIPRLIDLGVEPFLLGATINAIVAQRLVRKICPDCAEQLAPSQIEITELQRGLADVPPEYLQGYDLQNFKVKKGKGCEKCELSGYRGRLAIFEVLPMDNVIQELVMKKASPNEMYKAAKQFGMTTMKQDGFIKVLGGETSVEEVVRVTTE